MSYVVPPIVMFLNKHPMVAKADLSSLNRVISGAAPLGPEMVSEFHNKNPNCHIGQGESLPARVMRDLSFVGIVFAML